MHALRYGCIQTYTHVHMHSCIQALSLCACLSLINAHACTHTHTHTQTPYIQVRYIEMATTVVISMYINVQRAHACVELITKLCHIKQQALNL